MLSPMVHQLPRRMPLADLHCHLGSAVTPSIMWGIAHAQGIKLPTKDYWEFREMITASLRRGHSFNGYLDLFHWTELIQSSPLAVERSVYEVIGGAYRKNNVTTTELRFNPMKRNRGGEQDLDHIIAAALRGMDRAMLEYPIRPGLIFCLDRAFPFELNEIIAEKAIAWRDRGVVGIDIAGPEATSFVVADYRDLFRRARKCGLGITVHAGEAGTVEEMAAVIELLEPDRIGHGVKSAYDPRTMGMLRERAIVLEVCPTSNLQTGVVSSWAAFRDQHRRPRDAADVHPRRAGDSGAAPDPLARRAGPGGRNVAGGFVRAEGGGGPGADSRACDARRGRARRGVD